VRPGERARRARIAAIAAARSLPEALPMDSMIEQLADYASSLRFEELPSEVVRECGRKLLDTLGCAAGGFRSRPAAIARAIARRATGDPPARILGTLEPSTPELAAFANGVAARYLDFNDTYMGRSPGHPSDMFAALLAAAEIAHADGRAFVVATVLAYEVFGNLADCAPRDQGWDHTVYGVLGAALGAGALLGLKREQLAHAVALALTPNLALGQTRTGELSMWKGCAAANASRNGLFAALLAREGMTGPAQAIEGKWGLWNALGRFRWAPFGGRGGPYRILEAHIKRHPAVIHAQTPISVAVELHGRAAPEEIERIAIETYWVAERYADRSDALWNPATRETADHSIPYCVAAALLDGEVTERTFSAERLADARLRALIARTEVRENPDYTAAQPGQWPCRIELALRGGGRLAAEARYFEGHARRPLSDSELERKFRALASPVLAPERIAAILERTRALERLADLGELVALFDFRDERAAPLAGAASR
jgi:2-methylcitrate dehydratase